MHRSANRFLVPRPGFIRALLLLTLLLAATAASHAATLTVTPYSVEPVADGDALSERVYQVIATEKADGGGVKVWIYPLLWDSPEPPPASPISEMFGSLPPGQYRFGMRIRALEAPTDLRVSWIPDPSNLGSADNQVQTSIPLDGLSPSRWYNVQGEITVSGQDDWNGRSTIALISTSGNPARRLTVWLDDLELVQLTDDDADTDGCDPHCYRSPLDFEDPSDSIGSDPARVHHLTFRGQHILAGVSHNMPWQPVPEWFEQNRVQVGTRLKGRDCVSGQVAANNTWPVNGDTFLNAAANLKSMGVNLWTRHFKTADEGPWWQTMVPSSESRFRPLCVNTPLGNPDIATEIIAKAHQADTRQIAYYWMSSEEEIRLNYPEVGGELWSAVAAPPAGGPIASTNRGFYVTQNSSYPAEIVERRLGELVDRGVDAIRFDAQHNPEEGDFSQPSRDDFAAAGLGAFPVDASFNDPQYHRLLELYSLTLRDSFRRYHFAVHDKNPDTVMIVGSATLPALWEPQPLGAFAEDQQVIKGEWQQAWKRLRWLFARELPTTIPEPEHKYHLPPRDVQSAFSFALIRDSAMGRPGQVWVFRPAMNPCGPGSSEGIACDEISGVDALLSQWQLSTASGALMTYGNAANLDILETNILGGDERYRQALAFGNSDGPGNVLAGLRPHRWIGIHFNEHARQEIYASSLLSRQQKQEKAWNEVIAPAVWAFATLQAHGVPAVIVTDEQLARGELYGYAAGDDNGFEILFLPTDNLRSEVDGAVDRFEAGGGELIRSATANGGEPWTWHTPADGQGGWDTAPREAAAQDFLELLGLWTDGRVLDAPVEVFFAEDLDSEPTPSPVAPHIAAYADPSSSGRLVLALSNRWDWMLNMTESIDGCTSFEPDRDCLPPEKRASHVPSTIGKGKIFLRRGLLKGDETFRYATVEDPSWKDIPPNHINVATTANGVRVILSMDDGDADPDDDITFRSTLLIEATPPQP